MTEQRLKKYLQERTNEAYAIARNIIVQNDGLFDDITLQKLVKDSLCDIRFQNGRGYCFAFNTLGLIELHPIHPKLEGKILSTTQANLGNFAYEDALKAIKSAGGGFYSYSWSMPDKSGNKKTN